MQCKKKRDELPKMVGRVNFSHKRLQERMKHIVKFKRQQEQLRTVIVRVLRPTLAMQVSQTHQQESCKIMEYDLSSTICTTMWFRLLTMLEGMRQYF